LRACPPSPQDYAPSQLAFLELPFRLKDKYAKKGGGSASVTVGVVGAALTYPSLRSLMAAVPGAMFNDVRRILYAPLPQFGGLVYVGAEYDVRWCGRRGGVEVARTVRGQRRLFARWPPPPDLSSFHSSAAQGACVDVKVFVTQPSAPVHVDMVLPGRAKTKLLRSTYPAGQALINNLVAFEEMKLDDVKLSELASLQARCFRRPLSHVSCRPLSAVAPES